MAKKKKRKNTIDWKRIEKDFRTGKWSIRQLAEIHDVTEGAIRYHVKSGNWTQRIKAAPEGEFDTFRKLDFVPPTPTIRSREDATTVTRDGKNLAVRMLNELKAATSLVDELEDMIISETAGDRDQRRRQGMLRAVDLPARANTLKTLGLALKAFSEAARAETKEPDDVQAADHVAVVESGDDWDRLLN